MTPPVADAPRIIVGRALAQAGALKQAIAELGITALYQQLLAVEPVPGPADFEERLSDAQAIVVTSLNAVARLSELTRKRFMPVLAVGDATARAARRQGFPDVASAAGDSADLLELCNQRLRPGLGRILYLRGTVVARDMAADLIAAGHEVDEIEVYSARLADRLRPPVEAALREASISAVMLFSPRSADNFVSLVRKAGLENACAGISLLALSARVAEAADGLVWHSRLIAETPSAPGMLAILRQWREARAGRGEHSG